MNKKSYDLHYLNYLFNKLVKILYPIGIKVLGKQHLRDIFFKDLIKVDPCSYIFKNNHLDNIVLGFRTFYCSVNTFVPEILRNCWASDHHILSIYIKIASRPYNIIPLNNNLYNIYNRSLYLPRSSYDDNELDLIFKASLINKDSIQFNQGFINWVNLFRSNNNFKYLLQRGANIFGFRKIEKNDFMNMIRDNCNRDQYYHERSPNSIYVKKYQFFRKKIINEFEKAIASLIF